MLTTQELYVLMSEQVDTNTRNQVSLDKPRFVLFFNDAQDMYLKDIIDNLRSSDLVQKAQKFLEQKPLSLSGTGYMHEKFEFPDDYLKREEVIGIATSGSCGTGLMSLEEIKPSDVDYWLTDEYLKPSFDYRESFYYVGEDSVNIYNDGSFTFSTVNLIYYRKPVRLDIAGYEREDGSASEDIETEWEEPEVRDIIKVAVDNFIRSQLPIKAEQG